MKIAVCLKRVPDTASKIRIGDDGKAIDPSDVQYIISSYDEFAVEEAIRLKEHLGGGTVTVICLGPAQAQQNLRQALAMGADDGVLLKEDGELDPYQIGKALAATLAERGDDIVMFGRQSVDNGNGLVGPITARLLGIPCVTEIVKLSVDGNSDSDGFTATVEREIEGAREVVEVALPAAFTAHKGLNEPRYASLKGIMAAKKKPIEEAAPTSSEARLQPVSLELPAPRPEGQILAEGVEGVPDLVRLLREQAKVI